MTDSAKIPETIHDVSQLEELLSEPSAAAVETLGRISGDFIILGVGGKMGPTLARMIVRGVKLAGRKGRVIGVSRFSGKSGEASKTELVSHGVETTSADILNPEELAKLPECANVIYMAGMKFGSTGQEAMTWAMNTFLPGMVAQKFQRSKIVAFSTGNNYGLAPVALGGSVETDPLNPVGDYAMSCVGRERMFEHFSRTLKIPTAIIRLNYATELRYGVLVDLCRRVLKGEVIDVSMGNVNVIWQGDANAMTICSLDHAASPPYLLNVAGPEMLSVRRVCQEFGELLGKEVKFSGSESPNALLNNGQMGHRLYGYPRVSVQSLIRWTADWVKGGGHSLGKPTHFEARDGKY